MSEPRGGRAVRCLHTPTSSQRSFSNTGCSVWKNLSAEANLELGPGRRQPNHQFFKVLVIWGQHTYCQWNVLESGARVEEHQNSNTQRGSKHLLGSCAPPCMCTGPSLQAPTKLSALHWDGHFRTTAPGRGRPPWPAEQGDPVLEAVLPEEHPSPSQPLW